MPVSQVQETQKPTLRALVWLTFGGAHFFIARASGSKSSSDKEGKKNSRGGNDQASKEPMLKLPEITTW